MNKRSRRVEKDVRRGNRFQIIVNGERIDSYEGETVCAALMAAGLHTLRTSKKRKEPRGMFCGIGLCQECRMKINGVPNTQACRTMATPECRIETGPADS